MVMVRCRRVMSAVLVALVVMLFTPITSQARTWHGTTHATAHVYLLRGLMNVFSLGMDELAAKIRAQ